MRIAVAVIEGQHLGEQRAARGHCREGGEVQAGVVGHQEFFQRPGSPAAGVGESYADFAQLHLIAGLRLRVGTDPQISLRRADGDAPAVDGHAGAEAVGGGRAGDRGLQRPSRIAAAVDIDLVVPRRADDQVVPVLVHVVTELAAGLRDRRERTPVQALVGENVNGVLAVVRDQQFPGGVVVNGLVAEVGGRGLAQRLGAVQAGGGVGEVVDRHRAVGGVGADITDAGAGDVVIGVGLVEAGNAHD